MNRRKISLYPRNRAILVPVLALFLILLVGCVTIAPGGAISTAVETPPPSSPTVENLSPSPVPASETPVQVPSASPTEEHASTATTPAEQATKLPGESLGGSVISLSNVDSLQVASSVSATGARGVVWADGGKSLVVAGEEEVVAFNLASTALPESGNEITSTGITRLVSSPQAGLLAWTGEEPAVEVWDSRDGSEPRTFSGVTEEVFNLAFSSDESLLAAASMDSRIILWKTTDGTPVDTWELGYVPTDLSFSPDGSRLGATDQSSFTVHIYDVISGEELRVLEWTEHASPILYGAFFSPDWQTLAWVARGTVQLMDIETGELGQTLGHEDFITDTTWAPDEHIIATAAAGTVDGNFSPLVILWNVSTGEPAKMLVLANPALDITFSPDGTRLAVLDSAGEVQIFGIAP